MFAPFPISSCPVCLYSYTLYLKLKVERLILRDSKRLLLEVLEDILPLNQEAVLTDRWEVIGIYPPLGSWTHRAVM